MEQGKDYIYVKKIDLNEGLTSGTITKAAAFFTKSHLFVLPLASVSFLGDRYEQSKYPDMQAFIDELIQRCATLTTEEFEMEMTTFLPSERVYTISRLPRFKVQSGFWIFGGISLRTEAGTLQSINVQPQKVRAAIKAFYNL